MTTPAKYGAHLASLEPPITDEQAREFAKNMLSNPNAGEHEPPTATGPWAVLRVNNGPFRGSAAARAAPTVATSGATGMPGGLS